MAGEPHAEYGPENGPNPPPTVERHDSAGNDGPDEVEDRERRRTALAWFAFVVGGPYLVLAVVAVYLGLTHLSC